MKTLAFNPYLPSYEYIPDGEPRVFGDRVYVYGSHDLFEGADFCLGDYVCWSAPLNDLGAWRYEGVIWERNEDPINSDGRMPLFAPDVVQGPDGRYYLYYALSGTTVISVAVCDTPAGHYRFHGHVHNPDGHVNGLDAGEVFHFDPGVLVDDDGRVWMYTGFSPKPGTWLHDLVGKGGQRLEGAYAVELEPDMVTIRTQSKLIVPGVGIAAGTEYEDHPFFEASSPRKINGKYYFVYSSFLSHELCYAVSDRPDGGYTYGGTIVSIGDIGLGEQTNYTGNTHGGLVKMNGEWYIFYHRQTNKQKCCRQGCAEKVTILPDGSIPQAEITSCGLNGGPLPGTGTYEARIACNLGCNEPYFPYVHDREDDTLSPYFTQTGGDRDCDPDQYIANMRSGAWCGFKYFDFGGTSRITVTAKCTGSGRITVTTARHGEAIAVIPVTASAEAASYTAACTPLHGTLPLYFTYEGDGILDMIAITLA